MQQLPRGAQPLLTLRAAELLRWHDPEKTVAGGGGVTLLDLPAHGQRRRLIPSQASPHQIVLWCRARSSMADNPAGG